MKLTPEDLDNHRRSYIDGPTLMAAGVYRVPSIEGRDLIGRKGGGDWAGVVYPCRSLVTGEIVVERLRLDNPPLDTKGKPEGKYRSAPGARNHIYTVIPDLDLLHMMLADRDLPIIFCEGEKKALALFRLAWERATIVNGARRPLFLPLAFFGVYSWRGVIGISTDSNGQRQEQRGPIPDLDLVSLEGRRTYLVFDSNVQSNDGVRIARAQLARELEGRGAETWLVDLPPSVTLPNQAAAIPINGPDDYLGIAGPDAFLQLLWGTAARFDWHKALARSDRGKILPGIGNILLALELAPAWHGVLAFNEFSNEVEIRRPTPFDAPPGPWKDNPYDLRTAAWLESKGIKAGDLIAGKAVQAVAREHPFHPVRAYLNGLKWDGAPRLDGWLTRYLGAEDTELNRAIGACWIKSGVARVFQPGCPVHHTLVLEGPQGIGKSRALAILGGEWYSDDLPDLAYNSREAVFAMHGHTVIEISELDSLSRADASRIKSFLSRDTDRVREPYGRTVGSFPRQAIFAATTNHDHYLKDESGGRRFWPIACGQIDLDALRRDRDQLWAEAKARYDKGEKWWLDDNSLIQAAVAVQEERFQSDPWEGLIEPWLLNRSEVTTADVLAQAVHRESGQWTRADEMRVSAILGRLGWKIIRREWTGSRRRFYGRVRDMEDEAEAAAHAAATNGTRPAVDGRAASAAREAAAEAARSGNGHRED